MAEVTVFCPMCETRSIVTVPESERRQAEQFGECADGSPGVIKCDDCTNASPSFRECRQFAREAELARLYSKSMIVYGNRHHDDALNYKPHFDLRLSAGRDWRGKGKL